MLQAGLLVDGCWMVLRGSVHALAVHLGEVKLSYRNEGADLVRVQEGVAGAVLARVAPMLFPRGYRCSLSGHWNQHRFERIGAFWLECEGARLLREAIAAHYEAEKTVTAYCDGIRSAVSLVVALWSDRRTMGNTYEEPDRCESGEHLALQREAAAIFEAKGAAVGALDVAQKYMDAIAEDRERLEGHLRAWEEDQRSLDRRHLGFIVPAPAASEVAK